ncbi:aminomethyltransferase beta-barrel domain-containing protein, partial [Psychrobacter urativorans]|uniref:aminomethyltransferase beta-barrel domain-containing protein n=2 Tax=Moraxellaceae TaxID=468 RepID=UPI003BB75D8B
AYKLDWVDGLPPAAIFSAEGLPCMAKSRYRQPDQACRVFATNADGSEVKVVFDELQRAVTPGQSAVFYIDEVCLGGGVIASINAPRHL